MGLEAEHRAKQREAFLAKLNDLEERGIMPFEESAVDELIDAIEGAE